MPSIQIHILDGPAANRTQVFDQEAIRFGRDGDNDIVLTLPTASREHGELTFQNDQWVVINHSANGTEINGRAVRKPRALRSGDTVTIGKQPILRVTIKTDPIGAGDASTVTVDDRTAPVATSGMDRKTKLYLGIGIYVVVMLLLMVIFKLLPESEQAPTAMVTPLTAAQIAEDVQRPLNVPYSDPREADRYLEQARELYNQMDVRPENVYYTYEAFQLSLAHQERDRFSSGLDQRQFLQVQERLTRDVERRYNHAVQLVREGDYRGADESFRVLLSNIYPRRDGDSIIARNINEHRAYITRAGGR